MKRYKHFSDHDRISLYAFLESRTSLQTILKRLKISRATFYRELKRGTERIKGTHKIKCKNRRFGLCNGCEQNYNCFSEKIKYRDNISIDRKKMLNYNKKKPRKTQEQLDYIDSLTYPGLKNGQSLFHIYNAVPELQEILSISGLRYLIMGKYLKNCAPLDIRGFTGYKNSKYQQPKPVRINRLHKNGALVGRMFRDLEEIIKKNPRTFVTELDSVIGKRNDKKAILTITFRKYNFQFGFLIDKGNPNSVNKVLHDLFMLLTPKIINKLFGHILCDNGSEFSKLYEIENYVKEANVKVFYAEPYCSYNKATCESLHRLIRYFLSKGISFNNLTQKILNDVFSNINSYIRKSLNKKTPYEAISRIIPTTTLELFGIRKVDKRKVKLKKIK